MIFMASTIYQVLSISIMVEMGRKGLDAALLQLKKVLVVELMGLVKQLEQVKLAEQE